MVFMEFHSHDGITFSRLVVSNTMFNFFKTSKGQNGKFLFCCTFSLTHKMNTIQIAANQSNDFDIF